MYTDSSILTQVGITFLPKLNTRLYLPLIETCGGIEGFFHETDSALNALYDGYHLKKDAFKRRKALDQARQELENIDLHDIRVCSIEHSSYPFLLRQCEDAPIVFYYKGFLNDDTRKYLAIVGTRRASDRCRNRVDTLLNELSERDPSLVIVSGLAFGIDISAHQASLKYGLPTYAVLGHGLNMIYPASHKNIAEKILAANGALITEFPCSTTVLPVNFLQRNRIIAGLCQATLVAESAEKGGAMATARLAYSYNREVIAFPGRPEDKMSAGCNLLIKQNIAALTETSEDIAQILKLPPLQPAATGTPLIFSTDNTQENLILQALTEKGGMNIDELTVFTHIPVNELCALLTKLELEEAVLSLPGKNYILK